jgi:hypothetical protein
LAIGGDTRRRHSAIWRVRRCRGIQWRHPAAALGDLAVFDDGAVFGGGARRPAANSAIGGRVRRWRRYPVVGVGYESGAARDAHRTALGRAPMETAAGRPNPVSARW